ncbi:hypothetical protein C8Q73DRAFT_25269 [Cubamyces lactineus]|nr:hypothetical protein C8Q73DRAFT_25269 [Cubamyces lactineus]
MTLSVAMIFCAPTPRLPIAALFVLLYYGCFRCILPHAPRFIISRPPPRTTPPTTSVVLAAAARGRASGMSRCCPLWRRREGLRWLYLLGTHHPPHCIIPICHITTAPLRESGRDVVFLSNRQQPFYARDEPSPRLDSELRSHDASTSALTPS